MESNVTLLPWCLPAKVHHGSRDARHDYTNVQHNNRNATHTHGA
jgi:hypothetical protein